MDDFSQEFSPFGDLNDRSREVFRHIVDSFLDTGEPVGSRTLSRKLTSKVSPATIRNVMADLEELGLLYAPHTSAGRLPTDQGLRLFVDGLLEVGRLSTDERASIDAQCAAIGRGTTDMLQEATQALSGLSRCAGMVVAPKRDERIKHIEFVSIDAERALVVLVSETGAVENRMIEVPTGLKPTHLIEAANYLNNRLLGRTFEEARTLIRDEIAAHKAQIDVLTQKLVELGLDSASSGQGDVLIVRGHSNLLEDVNAIQDLERVRSLFQALETKDSLLKLIDATKQGEGVRIFIGSESSLFDLAGCSVIVAPYQNAQQQVLGAIGVIGPMRMNYARIIPMVDYTSKVIARLLA